MILIYRSTPLLLSYPCEIWPFRLRARGLALTSLSTYVGIFFNTFVNPIALQAMGWRYYLVYVVILIIVVITVYFCYPETRGYSLEELSAMFDGNGSEAPDEADLSDMETAASNQHNKPVVSEQLDEVSQSAR